MKYKVCPYCGSNLDPSERCDCQQERRNEQEEQNAERRKEEEGEWQNSAMEQACRRSSSN